MDWHTLPTLSVLKAAAFTRVSKLDERYVDPTSFSVLSF